MPSRKTPTAATAKKTAAAAPAATPRPRSPRAKAGSAAAAQPENENRSSEVMVVRPAGDEPVRCGGHILTDQGWVVEDHLVPADADAEGETAPVTEQE